MKVAAYQAPLRVTNSIKVIDLIREQVSLCETNGVEVLCCPEGVLGGLADYTNAPRDIAIDVEGGQLQCELSASCLDFYHKPVKTARRKLTIIIT